MIQIIWIISFIVLSQGSKEPYQNLDQLLNDPDIWKYIQKRVDDGDTDKNYDPTPVKIDKTEKHEQYRHPELTETSKHKPIPYGMKTLSDTSGNSCNYRENSSMIIKSKTSLNNGAFYLKNAFGLSAKECVEKCCYTQNCNLAVYEDKEEYSCYLFDCGTPSKCSFAHHGNYTVMSLQAHNYQPHAHQQYHENELESLGKTPRPTPAVPTTRTPKPETPTPNPPKVKVPLYGDCDIDWGEQCGDRNAECRDLQCKCKEGYHAIYAYCRKICSADEFQCNNKGYDRNVPDCIDSKHKCDGVPQCADGSDEANCPAKTEENDGSKSIGNNNGSQGSIVNNIVPGIPNKVPDNTIQKPPNNQPVLLPNTGKIPNLSSNQFYGQVPDKTGFVNPNVYGNSNPLIPKQIQDYYWPQQQGLLNNPQYQAPYSDYPQFQSQQIGQGYMNNLGYSGQKYNYPYNSGSKLENSNLNSNFFGAYSPNQNAPLKKYPMNQVYDKNVNNDMNSNYQESLKPGDGNINSYPKYDMGNQYPGQPKNRNWANLNPNIQPTPQQMSTTAIKSSPMTTVTTTTSTTTTTTTTTTAAPVVTTTIKHSKIIKDKHRDDDYNPSWSKNDDNYYHGNRQHKLKEAEEQKPHRTKNPDRHYKNPRIDTDKSEEEKSHNNYPERYPYRFQQQQKGGKYPDYEDRVRYNWPEYYDDQSEYSDFHQQYPRPGKKMDMYEDIFEGDNKDTDNGEEDKDVKDHGVHADNTEHKTPEAVIPDNDKSVNTDTDGKIVKIEEEDKYGKEEEKMDTENTEDKDEKEKVDTQNAVTKSTTSVSETPKTTVKTIDFEVPKKVIVKSPTDSSQGPIVALALGLGICLMLLIFVGCRLRTVKRRIRRGKSLHSNEADYLINGMYL